MSFSGTVVREGKTVREAVDRGLRSLGIREEQADIEVLSPGRKGFLGLGFKPARVRVSIKEEVVAELKLKNIMVDLGLDQSSCLSDRHVCGDEVAAASLADAGQTPVLPTADSAPSESAVAAEQASPEAERPQKTAAGEGQKVSRPGSVAVKDGALVITNPVGGGRFATVKPDRNVRLVVNGVEETEETGVTEQDEIRVEMINDEPEVSFELSLALDKMEAYMRLVRVPGARYRLRDQEAGQRITLAAEVAEIIEPPAVTADDVRRFLEEKNVVRGILEDGIAQVLANPNVREEFLVARGQEPVHGVDARVTYPFLDRKKESPFDFDRLVSVDPGDVVAVKIPKVEGRDGWTVTGEILPARKPEDCAICVKNGCELAEDGDRAVAVISGRPVIEESGGKICVHIDPVLVVPEVSKATGNIVFSGDVEVKGDVRDGCRIEASGNVQVMGDVSRATIVAGASVILHKNVFGSTVIAGGRAAVYSSIRPHLEETGDLLRRLCETVAGRKTAASPGQADDGPLIQSLIDEGYRDLPVLAGKLFEMVPAMARLVHEEVLDHIYLLHTTFSGLGALRLNSAASLEEISAATEDVINLIDCSLLRTDSIKARYVQNTSLVSGGDIIIDGQGCYISSLNAGGRVIVTGQPGVARGVKVTAGGTVEFRDLGSEFETRTYVKTKKENKILAEQVYADVIIQVGNEKFRVDRASRKFAAYLDAEGALVVDRLTADENPPEQGKY